MFRRTLRSLASTAKGIKVGDKLPDVSFDLGFPPAKVPLSKICAANKKFVIVGLPGAFTPT